MNGIEEKLVELQNRVLVTLVCLPEEQRKAETEKLKKRVALLEGLPETESSMLKAWLDSHEER